MKDAGSVKRRAKKGFRICHEGNYTNGHPINFFSRAKRRQEKGE